MILVTGATGNLGSAAVLQLLKNTSAKNIAVLARDENKAKHLKEKGIDVRIGSYDEIPSLDHAMQGIDKLLMISSNGQTRLQHHKNVLAAAKKAGIKHLVYTGIAMKNIETAAIKPYMIDLIRTEDYIHESGIIYTVLRNTLYAGGNPLYAGAKVFETGIVLPAGNGKAPFALRSEMGEAAANVLLQDGHENKTYEITNSELYSFKDVADALSSLSGKNVTYTDIDPQTFPPKLTALGLPEIVVKIVSGFATDIKNHQFENVTKDLEKLLGRKPASLKESLKEIFNL
jgi:NAD(P)H dehydrogenase (quinone)